MWRSPLGFRSWVKSVSPRSLGIPSSRREPPAITAIRKESSQPDPLARRAEVHEAGRVALVAAGYAALAARAAPAGLAVDGGSEPAAKGVLHHPPGLAVDPAQLLVRDLRGRGPGIQAQTPEGFAAVDV